MHGLRHMGLFNLWCPCQIGDGLRYFFHPADGPPRPSVAARGLQQMLLRLGAHGQVLQLRWAQVLVAHPLAGQGAVVGGLASLSHKLAAVAAGRLRISSGGKAATCTCMSMRSNSGPLNRAW